MADRYTLQSGTGIIELQASTDDLLLQSSPATIPLAVGDTLSPTETITKEVRPSLLETLGLAEGFTAVKTIFLTIGDTLGLTESNLRQVNKTVGETVALTETLVKSLDHVFAETVSLTETRVLGVEKRFAETVALAEAIAFQFFKISQETVGLTEELETLVVAGSSPNILHPHLQLGCTFQGIMQVGEI